jgi:hypothetical protein
VLTVALTRGTRPLTEKTTLRADIRALLISFLKSNISRASWFLDLQKNIDTDLQIGHNWQIRFKLGARSDLANVSSSCSSSHAMTPEPFSRHFHPFFYHKFCCPHSVQSLTSICPLFYRTDLQDSRTSTACRLECVLASF